MTKRKRFDSTAKNSAIAVFEDELKRRSDGYVEHLSHGGKADCGEEFYLDALYMAIAALREQPRWISVEERLPEPGQMVLVCCRSQMYKMHVTVSTYTKDYSCIRGCYWSRRVRHVTHWMPLPEPPEVSHG